MGIFSPDVWTHCNYIAETFGDMFLTHCDTSVPTFTILMTHVVHLRVTALLECVLLKRLGLYKLICICFINTIIQF